MNKFRRMLKKDVGELYSGLFKDNLYGLVVLMVLCALAVLYFWTDYHQHETDTGEVAPLKRRNFYTALSAFGISTFFTASELFKRIRKSWRRKRHLDRIRKMNE